MKRRPIVHLAQFTALTAAALLAGHSAQAADAAWNVNADGAWNVDANWNPAAAPGATVGTTSPDTATFGFALTTARTVTVDANRNISGINFTNTSSSGYTLSGGNLLLSTGGTIQNSGAGSNHTDTVNSAISLQGDYNFAANSTNNLRLLSFGSLATITSAATSGTTTLNLGGTNTNNGNAVAGIISNGTGTNVVALVKSGTGSWALNGANTFSGGVTVQGGTLSVGNGTAAGTGGVTLQNGSALRLTVASFGSAVTVSGLNANATLLTSSNTNGYAGNFSGSADQTISIVGTGSTAVNVSGAAVKQFQSFLGTVSIGAGQRLEFRSTGVNNGGDNTLFDVNGTLTTRNNGALALGALSGSGLLSSGTSGANNTTLAYTIGARGTDTTFSGVISDGDTALGKRVAVVKTGASSLTLSGVNTYTGLTTVNQGTLATSGSGTISAGNVTLLGTNPVVLTLGSTVSLGDSATLTFASNSIINLNFTGSDTLFSITNGALSIGAGTYTAADLNTFFGGSNFVDAGALGGTLLVTVPEPSSVAVMFGGVCLLAIVLRRRAKSSHV